MEQLLQRTELFDGLSQGELQRLAEVGSHQVLREGEYLFLLGENAIALHVVTKGNINLCFPMPLGGTVKDLCVESVGVGKALGWSALVKPYRFTLSARATEPSEVMSFPRRALVELFAHEPRIAQTFFTRISELIGIRLATFQALWVRELRRLAERPINESRGVQTVTGGQ
jgi:CRP-like cAMP-binding protein